jgi:tetratricopeptide (TPR) repeat protein
MQSDWTPEEIYLLTERGYALYQQGSYVEASIIFEGVTAVDPLNTYARTALATVHLALGDANRAINELSVLLERNPRDEESRARRCEAYCQAGNWAEASKDLTILRRSGSRHHVQRLTWRLETRAALDGRPANALSR